MVVNFTQTLFGFLLIKSNSSLFSPPTSLQEMTINVKGFINNSPYHIRRSQQPDIYWPGFEALLGGNDMHLDRYSMHNFNNFIRYANPPR